MSRKLLYIISSLFLFSLILTVVNYFWITHNLSHLPPPWDQSAYMHMSIHKYEILRQGNVVEFLKTVWTQAPHIAPLFPITVIPFFMLFGISVQTAYLANSLYLLILLVSVFFIAERIEGTNTAFVAVFLVATFPAVIAYSRDFLFEFPLASLTALSYLFFLWSDSFAARKPSVLFGVCTGLAVLTKTMGMVFFVMPFLYGIYASVRGSKEIKKNVIYAFLAAFCVAFIYYVPNFKHIFGYLFHFGVGAGSHNYNLGVSNMSSLRYWTIYFEAIARQGISLYYLLLFIAAAAVFLFARGKSLPREYWMLWLWFICGYVLLSIPHNKGAEQYALPILPPLALITAIHIARTPWKPAKYVMLGAVLAVGMTNYVYQSRSERCLYDRFFFKGAPVLIPEHSTCLMQHSVGMEGDKDWDITLLLHYMDDLNTDKLSTIRVLVAANHNFLNINNLKLYALLDKMNGKLLSDFSFEWIEDKSQAEIEQSLHESTFIITKTGFQGPVFANQKNSIVKNLLSNKAPLKIFQMPDGSFASVYTGVDKMGKKSNTKDN